MEGNEVCRRCKCHGSSHKINICVKSMFGVQSSAKCGLAHSRKVGSDLDGREQAKARFEAVPRGLVMETCMAPGGTPVGLDRQP